MQLSNMLFLSVLISTCYITLAQDDDSGTIWSSLQENGTMSSENLKAYKSLMDELQSASNKGRQRLIHKQLRPMENTDLFQGDLLLTAKQVKALRRAVLSNGTVEVGRSALIPENYWDRKIVYSVDRNSRVNEAAVEAGVKKWTELTCLTFTRNDNVRTGDYLQFFRGQGCYSWVGRNGGKQQISIGDGCEALLVVTHEMGHALGLWHEQSRTDRDQHIQIHKENIIDQAVYNFDKVTGTLAFMDIIPYDYGSIMHYDRWGFGKYSDKFTFTVYNPHYADTVGNSEIPSFYDVMAINMAYCKDLCSQKKAYYRGYPHPRDCSKLICPEGLGGNECKFAIKTDKNVGSNTLKAKSEVKTITASGKGKAYYFIKAPRGQKVVVKFHKIIFDCKNDCPYGHVGVQWEDIASSMAKICCDRSYSFTSKRNAVLLRYEGKNDKNEIKFTYQAG